MKIEPIDYDLNLIGELLPCSEIDRKIPLRTIIKDQYIPCPVDKLFVHKDQKTRVEQIIKNIIKKRSILIYGLGNVGGTILIALRMLLSSKDISHIGIYDKNKSLMDRYELEINQIHPPSQSSMVTVKPVEKADDISAFDIILFSAASNIPPLNTDRGNVRDVQFAPNRKILDEFIEHINVSNHKGTIIIVSDPVDILCTYLYRKTGLLASQITGMGLGVMAARANYLLEKQGYNDFYKKGQIFGPHNEGVIAVPDKNNPELSSIKALSMEIENLNFHVREKGFYPYIAPGISSVAYNLHHALAGREVLSCTYIDGIYWGFKTCFYNGLWFPVLQAVNPNVTGFIIERFEKFKEKTLQVMAHNYN